MHGIEQLPDGMNMKSNTIKRKKEEQRKPTNDNEMQKAIDL